MNSERRKKWKGLLLIVLTSTHMALGFEKTVRFQNSIYNDIIINSDVDNLKHGMTDNYSTTSHVDGFDQCTKADHHHREKRKYNCHAKSSYTLSCTPKSLNFSLEEKSKIQQKFSFSINACFRSFHTRNIYNVKTY